jgi:hypothetical protein
MSLLFIVTLALAACQSQPTGKNNGPNVNTAYNPQTRGFDGKWPWGPGP